MTILEEFKADRPRRFPGPRREADRHGRGPDADGLGPHPAMAMLSFGFTIYKFLEDFQGKSGHAGPDLPQHVGLFLAGIGTLSIVMGTFEYWTTLRDLNRTDRFGLGRPVLVVALVLSASGVTLFISIAFRLF